MWRTSGKLFCVGLARTGTRSLASALALLGYRTSHWEDHARIMDDVKAGRYRLSIMDDLDAVADLPIPLIYRELDVAFPGSRFILTVRDPQRWLASIETHMAADRGTQTSPYSPFWEEEVMLYGTRTFNRELFLRRYLDHNASVMDYFAGRPDLLVLDVAGGDGWEKLAPFCETAIPDVPFPRLRWSFDEDGSHYPAGLWSQSPHTIVARKLSESS